MNFNRFCHPMTVPTQYLAKICRKLQENEENCTEEGGRPKFYYVDQPLYRDPCFWPKILKNNPCVWVLNHSPSMSGCICGPSFTPSISWVTFSQGVVVMLATFYKWEKQRKIFLKGRVYTRVTFVWILSTLELDLDPLRHHIDFLQIFHRKHVIE